MNFATDHITLVGCGAMGAALLKGWLNADVAEEYSVIAPHRDKVQPYLQESSRVHWYASPEELPNSMSTLVIALKPFSLIDILPLYKPLITPNTLVISVATGKTLEFYRSILEREVIRAMPNTPVSINKGVIGLYANPEAQAIWGEKAEAILGSLGYIAWLENEDAFNQVTALSGSGPAYVFYMIEALARAGAKHGLTKQQAYEMALFTVAGAGAYAQQSGLDASVLRDTVTSPKGTTEQALKVLMSSDGLGEILEQAVEAAYLRAKELSK